MASLRSGVQIFGLNGSTLEGAGFVVDEDPDLLGPGEVDEDPDLLGPGEVDEDLALPTFVGDGTISLGLDFGTGSLCLSLEDMMISSRWLGERLIWNGLVGLF
jgi:hypothetical protein